MSRGSSTGPQTGRDAWWWKEVISGIVVSVEPNRYNGIGPDKHRPSMKTGKKGYRTFVRNRSYSLSGPLSSGLVFSHRAWGIEPQGGFYRQVFEAIKAKGIRLLSQSLSFDLPFALQEDGDGWGGATIKAYEDYARFCFWDLWRLGGWLPSMSLSFLLSLAILWCPLSHKGGCGLPGNITQLFSSLAVKTLSWVLPDSKVELSSTWHQPIRSQHPADQGCTHWKPLSGTIFPRSICLRNLSRRISSWAWFAPRSYLRLELIREHSRFPWSQLPVLLSWRHVLC